jgi:hypothetical protein
MSPEAKFQTLIAPSAPPAANRERANKAFVAAKNSQGVSSRYIPHSHSLVVRRGKNATAVRSNCNVPHVVRMTD